MVFEFICKISKLLHQRKFNITINIGRYIWKIRLVLTVIQNVIEFIRLKKLKRLIRDARLDALNQVIDSIVLMLLNF